MFQINEWQGDFISSLVATVRETRWIHARSADTHPPARFACFWTDDALRCSFTWRDSRHRRPNIPVLIACPLHRPTIHVSRSTRLNNALHYKTRLHCSFSSGFVPMIRRGKSLRLMCCNRNCKNDGFCDRLRRVFEHPLYIGNHEIAGELFEGIAFNTYFLRIWATKPKFTFSRFRWKRLPSICKDRALLCRHNLYVEIPYILL